MISKIIHQTAPKDESKWHILWKNYQQSWIDKFPDFEYRLWNDDELENLIKSNYRWFYDIYKQYDQNIKRIDAARYFILYEYGGIYADMDFECVNNFWHNIPQDNVSIAETGNLGVCRMENALMMSPKQHNFWMLVFSQLIENKDKHVFTATGPILIEKCIEQYNQENIGCSINVLSNRQYSLQNNDNDKYCIHHQTGVWLKKDKNFERIFTDIYINIVFGE